MAILGVSVCFLQLGYTKCDLHVYDWLFVINKENISVNRAASQNISFFEVTILTGALMTPPCTLEYFESVVNLAKTVRKKTPLTN